MRLRVALTAGVLGLAAAAAAQPEAANSSAPGNPLVYLVQALLALLFVLALIYGLFYLLRRTVGAAAVGRQSGPAEIVQSLPLNAGNVLHVVRLQERLYLVPSGPQGAGPVAAAETGGLTAEECSDAH